jgi:phosphopantetheinyl transferase (holo-ACP synthase)
MSQQITQRTVTQSASLSRIAKTIDDSGANKGEKIMNEKPYEGYETQRVTALAKLLVAEHAKKEGRQNATPALAQAVATSSGPALLQMRRLQDDEDAPIQKRQVTPEMIAQRHAAADALLAQIRGEKAKR